MEPEIARAYQKNNNARNSGKEGVGFKFSCRVLYCSVVDEVGNVIMVSCLVTFVIVCFVISPFG